MAMGFISQYVREQKRYTKNELRTIFQFSESENEKFINRLKSFGVLKAVQNTPAQRDLSDLVDSDIEVSDVSAGNDEYFYVFTYVGVITIGNRILKCFPKYIASTQEPLDEMRQVLRVLDRYSAKEQIINLYNGTEESSSFNLLAVILFLMNDYFESGLYTNTEDVVEVNGEGSILWDKTISDGFAMISNNRPYYVDIYTHRTIDDEQDFFLRLHKCILTECSHQMEEADLLSLFNLSEVDLSEESISDFGEDDYILYRLQSELNIQFNTRKQILLKTLYAYIAQHKTLEDSYGLSMYGTTSFNLVWEDVCATVFDDKLQTQLRHLRLPTPLADGYAPSDRLIDIIEKPKWCGYNEDGSPWPTPKEANETLIPDLVNIYEQGGEYLFVIFDAKYYCIQLEHGKTLRGQPGIGDVTKQYLYQLAYKKFLTAHGISRVRNCFLMPTEHSAVIRKGVASLQMLHELGLQDIQIRLLPAKEMYDCYLEKRIWDIERLGL
jgi:hypothetical protein